MFQTTYLRRIVQPIYTYSGHMHIATAVRFNDDGFDTYRLACSGKEMPAQSFRNASAESLTCKACKRIAAK